MSALLDRRYFPAYNELPFDCYVNLAFYHERNGILTPAFHWCFMAEIMDDTFAQTSFLRHRLEAKDRDGARMPILFYLDRGVTLDTTHFKTGNTIFVRYAEQHAFMDGSNGLRIENPSSFYVVPYSLSAIVEAHRRVTSNVCNKCQKKATLRCAKCKQAFYCSRECQVDNWTDHKAPCRILTKVAPVTSLDHTRFMEFELFH
ncbi:hypothetical protein BG011_001768 [Mortierella polycephala]|uniref:MYND-type domain-containing protein n=1 Tax=Mortierella polycephala TaxID=41804 RepID=A0A9P6UAI9_9FUNG|nr:hypothetical protein BG011_001768 [Mortierella polycephala]